MRVKENSNYTVKIDDNNFAKIGKGEPILFWIVLDNGTELSFELIKELP
ncbi:MAG: hypothetical protein KAI81_04405 [Candidatus Marinimicrobia bacterium]|nr:hypothetical protein [Candidatus Neomarinimicrobiota bacterium]